MPTANHIHPTAAWSRNMQTYYERMYRTDPDGNIAPVLAVHGTAAYGILRDVHWRIGKPEHWCQNAFATDLDGNPVWGDNPLAVRWSLLEALCLAEDIWIADPNTNHLAFDLLVEATGASDLQAHNNLENQSHGNILRAVRNAMQKASAGNR